MASGSRRQPKKNESGVSPQVKYRNALNLYSFSGLEKSEINITFALLCMFGERESTEIEFRAEELRRLIAYDSHHMTFERFVYEKLRKLQKFVIERWTAGDEDKGIESERASIVMFPYLALREKSGTITVKISPELSDLLHGMRNRFTIFTLSEMITLSSDYAKTLFRLLRQFSSSGRMTVPIDRFRFLMGIPDYYRMCDIDARVIRPALKELSRPSPDGSGPLFTDLVCEKIKGSGRGRGGAVKELLFTFMPVKHSAAKLRQNTSLRKKKETTGRQPVAGVSGIPSMADLTEVPALSEEDLRMSAQERDNWLERLERIRGIPSLEERFAALGKFKSEYDYRRSALFPDHAAQVDTSMREIFDVI